MLVAVVGETTSELSNAHDAALAVDGSQPKLIMQVNYVSLVSLVGTLLRGGHTSD